MIKPAVLLVAGGILLGSSLLREATAPTPPDQRTAAPAAPARAVPPILPDGRGCEPSGPARIRLQASDLGADGRARIDYVVEPVLDALDVDVELGFPFGGEARTHTRPAAGPLERGRTRSGTAKVALPFDARTSAVEVRARIAFADPDAPDGVSWQTSVQRVLYGEAAPALDNVRIVESGGETSIEIPATRTR